MAKTLKDLKRGAKKSVVREVIFKRTIKNYDRRLPAVLSTPSMIGQMEVAAGLLLLPYLPKGSISVGTHINVSHVAAAALGQKLRTTAVFERLRRPRGSPPRGRRGRPRYVFAVEAAVGKKLIGRGHVERALIAMGLLGP